MTGDSSTRPLQGPLPRSSDQIEGARYVHMSMCTVGAAPKYASFYTFVPKHFLLRSRACCLWLRNRGQNHRRLPGANPARPEEPRAHAKPRGERSGYRDYHHPRLRESALGSNPRLPIDGSRARWQAPTRVHHRSTMHREPTNISPGHPWCRSYDDGGSTRKNRPFAMTKGPCRAAPKSSRPGRGDLSY